MSSLSLRHPSGVRRAVTILRERVTHLFDIFTRRRQLCANDFVLQRSHLLQLGVAQKPLEPFDGPAPRLRLRADLNVDEEAGTRVLIPSRFYRTGTR